MSYLRVCLSPDGAKKCFLDLASPFRGWGSLTICVCANYKHEADVSGLPSFASIRHCDTIVFDSKKTLYFKEPPAKLLKTYLKDNGNVCFVVI